MIYQMDIIIAIVVAVGFASACYIFRLAIRSDIREAGFQVTRWIKFWIKK